MSNKRQTKTGYLVSSSTTLSTLADDDSDNDKYVAPKGTVFYLEEGNVIIC